MRKIKKDRCIVLLLLFVGILFVWMDWSSIHVLAAGDTDLTGMTERFAEASGADKLLQHTSDSVRDVLERYGISADNPDAVDALGISEVWQHICTVAWERITAPIRLLSLLLLIVFSTAILQSAQAVQQGSMRQISDLLVVMSAVTVSAPPVCSSFLQVRTVLNECTEFMTAFTPVFAGILMTSGSAGAAIGYQTAVYALIQFMIQIVDSVLLPFLSMGLAMTIADAANTGVSLGGMVRMSKTAVTWLLGLMMTIFLGVLSIQGIVRGAADSFAAKTVRYVVSNFVPIVGGAVSDAYGTVMGSLRILRSTTGIIGILSVCILFLPVFAELVLYRFAVMLAAAVSELFSTDALTRLLHGMEQVVQMAIAILSCFSILFVISIALILMLSTGSAVN